MSHVLHIGAGVSQLPLRAAPEIAGQFVKSLEIWDIQYISYFLPAPKPGD